MSNLPSIPLSKQLGYFFFLLWEAPDVCTMPVFVAFETAELFCPGVNPGWAARWRTCSRLFRRKETYAVDWVSCVRKVSYG